MRLLVEYAYLNRYGSVIKLINFIGSDGGNR